MPTFQKVQGVRHFEIAASDDYREGADELRAVYTIRANEKLTKLIGRLIGSVEGYGSYYKFRGAELVVIISCRGYEVAGEPKEVQRELLRQVTEDFGVSLMSTLLTELDHRREETPPATDETPKSITTLPDDEAFIYRNQGRFTKRLQTRILS